MAADDLGIEERLRRMGRAPRDKTVGVRFTVEEEKELTGAASRSGLSTREWAREVLLREARTPRSEVAVFTELIALRLLLTHALRPIAVGEKLTAEQYSQILTEVRTTKHTAAQDVLAQYTGSGPKEQ